MLSEKPWQLASIVRLVLGIFICLFIGGLASIMLNRLVGAPEGEHPIANVIIGLVSFQGATLVLVRYLLRAHGLRWSDAFGFKARPNRAVLLGFLAAILFLPIGLALQNISMHLLNQGLNHYEVKAVEEQAVQVLRTADSWTHRLTFGLLAILLVPIAEEVLFRGILYPAIKQAGFPRLALWGTSLFFAIIHSDLNAMFSFKLLAFAASLGTLIPLTLLALTLTVLYEKTGNLLSSITAHSVFNAANLVLLYVYQLSGRAS